MTQWLDAAVAINGGRPMAESCDPGASRPPKPGEHLRSLTNPSVLDLLRKRIEYAAAKLPSVACSLAFEAYHWDRPNALPLLQMVGSLKDCRADARLVAARLDLGDRGGVEPWIASIESAGAMEREASSKLAPFWMFPQDRFLAAHAERILASNAASAGFTPEFLGIASFRVQLLAVLENGTSAIGTAWRDEKGVSFGAVMLAGPGRGGMKIRQRPDYRDAPAGTRRTLRTKDLAAWNVSSIAGVRLGLDWTQEDRDQAIGEIARFIRENGDHLRVFPEHPTDWTCGRPSIFVKR